jgi:cell division transport system permease protein
MNSLFAHFLRSWKHHPLIQTSAFVVLTGTFTIVFSIYLFFANTERVLTSWGSHQEMNIFLKDSLSQEKLERLQQEMKELNYFRDLHVVTKESAANQFFAKMSKYVPEFANEKEFLNIMPSSIVATMIPGKSLEDIRDISQKIEKLDGVEDVSFGQDWVEKFSLFVGSVENIGWAISSFLILGALFVIGFTVYTVIVRRREEIEIFELCGATSKMIQLPYVFEGALLSLIAAIAGLILSYFLLALQNQFFVSEMMYLGLNDLFRFFGFFEMLALIALSTLVGALVAGFCIKKLNTGWSQATNYAKGET